MVQRWHIVFLASICMLLLGATPAPQALAVRSCQVGTGIYPSIQAAVDDVNCTVINLAAGSFAGPVVVGRNLTIQGMGASQTTLLTPANTLLIDITQAATVTIANLTIKPSESASGFFYNVIRNSGTLLLENLVVQDSLLNDSGIIANSGILTIQNSQFLRNGSNIISNIYGSLTISSSLFEGNGDRYNTGTLIVSYGGKLSINASTFSKNTVDVVLSGPYVNGITFVVKPGQLQVENSTFFNNTGFAIKHSSFDSHLTGGVCSIA